MRKRFRFSNSPTLQLNVVSKFQSKSIHLHPAVMFFAKNLFPFYVEAALYKFDLTMKNDSGRMLFRKHGKLFATLKLGNAFMKVYN